MPTYVIEGYKEVRIPAGPLRLTLHSSGGEDSVSLTSTSKGGEPTPNTIDRPGMLVIPALAEPAIITARPVGAPVFRQGTVLDLTVGPGTAADADPEQAVLRLDVSGLPERELVRLEVTEGRTAINHRGDVKKIPPVEGLARDALISARELLGVETVDPGSAVNIVIAIDASASMLPATRDGELAALVSVISGMSLVVSPDRSVTVAFVGSTVDKLDAGTADTLPGEVAARQLNRTLSTGFRSADPTLFGHAPDQNTVTFVLTDALPFDLPQLAAAGDVPGEAPHLVLFTEAAALRLQGEAGIPVTVVEPVATEGGLAQRLESDRGALRRLIASLLVGAFVPGTDLAKRVGA